MLNAVFFLLMIVFYVLKILEYSNISNLLKNKSRPVSREITLIPCTDYSDLLIRIKGNSIYAEDIVFLNNDCLEKGDYYSHRYKISDKP